MKRDPLLAQSIRATAYFLWEQDGRPEGREFEYWVRAKDLYVRQRAYDLWLSEGGPNGREDEIWARVEREIDET